MSIPSLAEFDARIAAPNEVLYNTKGPSTTAVVGRMMSLFTTVQLAGAIPSTAAVPARDIAGAIGQQNGTTLRAIALRMGVQQTGVWMLCDRLSHQGGLSGTTTGAQTTNLPTAALTRYTSGVGVMACLEIYTIIGTTGTSVRLTYTNQAGTGSRVSPDVVFGATNNREATRAVMIPNVSGDDGFRSVESVEILATTGTAGNFGVTLFKPLLYVPIVQGEDIQFDAIRGYMGGGLPEILDDACLFWMVQMSNTTFSMNYGLSIAED